MSSWSWILRYRVCISADMAASFIMKPTIQRKLQPMKKHWLCGFCAIFLLLYKTGVPNSSRNNRKPNSCGFLTFTSKFGIGNQLFKFAGSYAVAQQLNRTLVLPCEFRDIASKFMITVPFVCDISQKNLTKIGVWFEFMTENITSLKTKPCDKNSLMEIDAYFQEWRLFLPYWEELKSQIKFRPDIYDQAETIIKETVVDKFGSFSNVTLVGVHARRGDFVKEPDRFPASGSYIANAINNMRIWHRMEFGSQRKMLFLGVGDDNNWNKENFPVSDDVVVLRIRAAETSLCILSICNHTIMTVGTFGWWGGFLAGGKVIHTRNITVDGMKMARFFVPEKHFPPDWIPL